MLKGHYLIALKYILSYFILSNLKFVFDDFLSNIRDVVSGSYIMSCNKIDEALWGLNLFLYIYFCWTLNEVF